MFHQGVGPGLAALILVSLWLTGTTSRAEWTQQTITLRPGWNAVCIQVTPYANDVETVFQDIPVRSVWRHHVEGSSVRYIDDAVTLKPDSPDWLTWAPRVSPASVIKTLYKVHGGQCYLIDLDGVTNVTRTLVGRPVLSPLQWLSAGYSLVGLPINTNATTFAQFFAGSAAHQNVDLRQLSAAGRWTQVPATTPIVRGEAYWIYANGISSFQGQGSLQADNQGFLDFGNSASEQQLTLCNNTASNASFSLSLLPATVPAGAITAGDIALSVWSDNTNSYGWQPLNGSPSVSVPANGKKALRLAVRRSAMVYQGADRPFCGILSVTGPGLHHALGLRAQLSATPFSGLWSGQCIIRQVSEPAGADPDALQDTASETSLRLLVRVGTNGAQLLREAYIFWLEGVSDPEGAIVEPGRFLIAGSDAEVADLEATYGSLNTGRLKGAAVRDGMSVPRRLSSVGFSFTTPQPMAGGFGLSLSNIITIGFNDDLNPYKHRYHPDHDNLVDGSSRAGHPAPLPEGRESYTIERQITLQFQASDPEQLRFSGWGDSVVGGKYAETITGLHRTAVKAAGTFQLTKVVSQ